MGNGCVKEWVKFENCRDSKSGKTKIWGVCGVGVTSKGASGRLGVIYWFGRWRKYAFAPAPHTTFEKDCLRLIADFCETKSKAHMATKRAERKKK